MMLYEQYRPREWSDVIGHGQVVKSVARMRDRGTLGGKAFWVTGSSGIGKTSIAYLIAGDVCDPDNFIELDAGELTPAKLNDLEKQLRYRALGGKSGRALLCNESHGLRQDTVRKLLVILERIPGHVTWVFTTTNVGQQRLFEGAEDPNPLLSRCVQFKLDAYRYLEKFAARAKEIAEAEGLGGARLDEYTALVKRCECNFRMVLSEIEAGAMCRDAADYSVVSA